MLFTFQVFLHNLSRKMVRYRGMLNKLLLTRYTRVLEQPFSGKQILVKRRYCDCWRVMGIFFHPHFSQLALASVGTPRTFKKNKRQLLYSV